MKLFFSGMFTGLLLITPLIIRDRRKRKADDMLLLCDIARLDWELTNDVYVGKQFNDKFGKEGWEMFINRHKTGMEVIELEQARKRGLDILNRLKDYRVQALVKGLPDSKGYLSRLNIEEKRALYEKEFDKYNTIVDREEDGDY